MKSILILLKIVRTIIEIIIILSSCYACKSRNFIGRARFELATLWSQTRCATKLRYRP